MNAPNYLGRDPERAVRNAGLGTNADNFANMNSRPAPLQDRIAAVAYWAVALTAVGVAGLGWSDVRRLSVLA